MKLRRERPGDKTAGPLVEVAQHYAGTRDIDCFQEILVDQARRLFAALPKRSAKVDVEDVQKMPADADIRTQRSTLFAAGDAQVNLPDQVEIPSAQRDVAVNAATVLTRFTNGVEVSKPVRQIACLVILYGPAFVTDNFL